MRRQVHQLPRRHLVDRSAIPQRWRRHGRQEPRYRPSQGQRRRKDTGAFKTPTLLDISKSGPYLHDGSAETLEDAVDLMLKGGNPNKWLDEKNLADAKKANLSDDEKADLLAFLRSLDVDYTIEKPTLPE